MHHTACLVLPPVTVWCSNCPVQPAGLAVNRLSTGLKMWPSLLSEGQTINITDITRGRDADRLAGRKCGHVLHHDQITRGATDHMTTTARSQPQANSADQANVPWFVRPFLCTYITSIKSLSFCITTLSASLTNCPVKYRLHVTNVHIVATRCSYVSRDCSCCVYKATSDASRISGQCLRTRISYLG